MNILVPKYFTAVFRKQMGPSYRMDSQGPQSISFIDFDLLVWTRYDFFYFFIDTVISQPSTTFSQYQHISYALPAEIQSNEYIKPLPENIELAADI